MLLSSTFILVLLASLCFAHDAGSIYRVERYGLGDPNAQCWTKANGTNAPSLSAPCPVGLNINFTYVDWPSDFFIDEAYNIQFIITAQLDDITSAPEITHANVHGCVQSVGFCSPILAQQAGLVTFFGQATANLSPADNTTVINSPVTLSSEGGWTIICHARLIRGVAPNAVQWDFAYGVPIIVKKHSAKISTGALAAIGVVAGIVALLAFVMLVGVLIYQRHKVIRAATFPFCVIMLVCGIITLSTIVPLGHSITDSTCIAIPWLLAPATCLILCLLALRLRRVQVLFGEAALHPDMKRYWYLRNIYLLAFALAITGIQVVMLIIWSSIDDWRPRKVVHNSNLLTGFACGSRNKRAMPALYWTFVGMDALILGAAVVMAFLTRKAIALITYTFVFIGFVIIPIQKLVNDVTGIFVLRSIGIVLGVGSAIVLLFGPKF